MGDGHTMVAFNQIDVAVISDFLPQDLCSRVASLLSSGERRKLRFKLGEESEVPEVISEAARFASAALGLRFNVAILKWYRHSDSLRSGAYDAHVDPEQLRGVPLVLCTLRGRANLVYWNESGGENSVCCADNIAVVLKPSLVHRVTPPLNAEGERFLLFLGFDASLEREAGSVMSAEEIRDKI